MVNRCLLLGRGRQSALALIRDTSLPRPLRRPTSYCLRQGSLPIWASGRKRIGHELEILHLEVRQGWSSDCLRVRLALRFEVAIPRHKRRVAVAYSFSFASFTDEVTSLPRTTLSQVLIPFICGTRTFMPCREKCPYGGSCARYSPDTAKYLLEGLWGGLLAVRCLGGLKMRFSSILRSRQSIEAFPEVPELRPLLLAMSQLVLPESEWQRLCVIPLRMCAPLHSEGSTSDSFSVMSSLPTIVVGQHPGKFPHN